MKLPQLEDGYLKISNALIDAFCRCRLRTTEAAVLFAIIRKTYGFNKKHDYISITQFRNITGLHRPSIVRALKALQKRQIIGITIDTTGIYKCCIQKDYTRWGVVSPMVPGIKVPKKLVPFCQKTGITDGTYKIQTKDNTKNREHVFVTNNVVIQTQNPVRRHEHHTDELIKCAICCESVPHGQYDFHALRHSL